MKQRTLVLMATTVFTALIACNISAFAVDADASLKSTSASKGLVVIGRTDDGKYILHCQEGPGFPCTQCSLVVISKVIPIGELAD